MRRWTLLAFALCIGCASTPDNEPRDNIERAREAHALFKDAREELRKASMDKDLERFIEAVAMYEEVLEIEPEFHRARRELGAALYSLARQVEGEAMYLNQAMKDIEGVPVEGQTPVPLSAADEARVAEILVAFEERIERAGAYYERALNNLLYVESTGADANVYWQISDIYFFFKEFRASHKYLLLAMRSGDITESSARRELQQRRELLENLVIRKELEIDE